MSTRRNSSLGDESRATVSGVAPAPLLLADAKRYGKCGVCLWNTQDVTQIGADGICPKCGADYSRPVK